MGARFVAKPTHNRRRFHRFPQIDNYIIQSGVISFNVIAFLL